MSRRLLSAAAFVALIPAARAAAQPANHVYIGGGYEHSPYNYGYGNASTGCQFDASGSGTVAGGGTCNVLGGPGGMPTMTITTAASVDASGMLHASARVLGSIPRVPVSAAVPYGYSAGTDVFATTEDVFTITRLGAASPGTMLLFDVFLHGTATASIVGGRPKPAGSDDHYRGDNVGAIGYYTARLVVPGSGGAEGEELSFEETLYRGDIDASASTATIAVPFAALVFDGAIARLRAEQTLETYAVANIDPLFPGAVVTTSPTVFDVSAAFGSTAGLSNVRVLDARGADVSSAYNLRTSTRVFAVAVTATPEPATFALVGLGLAGVLGVARHRRIASRTA